MKNYQEPFCYHDGRNIVGKEFAQHNDVFPLYTSPPQRKTRHVSYVCPQCHYSLDEREPLTDEAIEQIADEIPVDDLSGPTTWHLKLARAIERAHGIIKG